MKSLSEQFTPLGREYSHMNKLMSYAIYALISFPSRNYYDFVFIIILSIFFLPIPKLTVLII